MFVRSKLDSKSGNQYIQICKSFRDANGNPNNKVIASLGSIDKLIDSDELKKLVFSLVKLLPDLAVHNSSELPIKEISRLNWGTPKILQFLWNSFDLDSFFNSVKSSVLFDFRSATFLGSSGNKVGLSVKI